MKKNFVLIIGLLFLFAVSCNNSTQEQNELEKNNVELENKIEVLKITDIVCAECEKLIKVYPDFISSIENNYLIWKDGTKMFFDDGKKKSFEQLIDKPDIQDMFFFTYSTGIIDTPKINFDPGRIRNEEFFKKMYGNNKTEVYNNLETVIWLPNTLNKKIKVSKINGISQKIQAISNQLDSLPHLHKYIDNMGGTFNWRKISGTQRLSAHSFGIAIDINVNHSNYWKWTKRKQDDIIYYKNKIPLELIEIFEKHGFIWGGRWYHYDSMHFEYRPELL